MKHSTEVVGFRNLYEKVKHETICNITFIYHNLLAGIPRVPKLPANKTNNIYNQQNDNKVYEYLE